MLILLWLMLALVVLVAEWFAFGQFSHQMMRSKALRKAGFDNTAEKWSMLPWALHAFFAGGAISEIINGKTAYCVLGWLLMLILSAVLRAFESYADEVAPTKAGTLWKITQNGPLFVQNAIPVVGPGVNIFIGGDMAFEDSLETGWGEMLIEATIVGHPQVIPADFECSAQDTFDLVYDRLRSSTIRVWDGQLSHFDRILPQLETALKSVAQQEEIDNLPLKVMLRLSIPERGYLVYQTEGYY